MRSSACTNLKLTVRIQILSCNFLLWTFNFTQTATTWGVARVVPPKAINLQPGDKKNSPQFFLWTFNSIRIKKTWGVVPAKARNSVKTQKNSIFLGRTINFTQTTKTWGVVGTQVVPPKSVNLQPGDKKIVLNFFCGLSIPFQKDMRSSPCKSKKFVHDSWHTKKIPFFLGGLSILLKPRKHGG